MIYKFHPGQKALLHYKSMQSLVICGDEIIPTLREANNSVVEIIEQCIIQTPTADLPAYTIQTRAGQVPVEERMLHSLDKDDQPCGKTFQELMTHFKMQARQR